MRRLSITPGVGGKGMSVMGESSCAGTLHSNPHLSVVSFLKVHHFVHAPQLACSCVLHFMQFDI